MRNISDSFTITIKKSGENYTVEADGSNGIRVDSHPSPELKALLLNEQIIATLKVLANEEGNANPNDVKKLGQALYNALFIQPIILAFGKAQGNTVSDKGVRLSLQIEPPELAALPWETLYDGQNWLSTQSSVPAVRKLVLDADSKTLQSLQVRGALRILFVGASPEGLPNLKIKETAIELRNLLAESIKKKQIVFSVLLNATLKELQQELVRDYHILYFAGHGSPEGIFLDDGEGDLIEDQLLRRKPGDFYRVSAKQLTQPLEGKPTRLLFLAACNTGTSSNGSRLLEGFAQELAKQSKLPAIVAMQYFISDMQANLLTKQFFAGLAFGHPVDVALAEARKVLIRQGQVGRDVFAPVLYLQAEDGALFQKAKNWPVISLSVVSVISVIVIFFVWQVSQKRSIIVSTNTVDTLVRSDKQLEAMLEAIKVEKQYKNLLIGKKDVSTYVLQALQQVVYSNQKTLLLRGMHVVFSPDGKLLATASDDDITRLWDTASGKQLYKLRGFSDGFYIYATGTNLGFNRLVFSPDGKLLVTVTKDNIVRLWHTASGRQLHELRGHSDTINWIVFSPDSKLLATASDDNIARLWDVSSGSQLHEHFGKVDRVVFSPDGKLLATTASKDATTRLWNTTSGKQLHELRGGNVVFSPDGKLLATVSFMSFQTEVLLWDTTSGKVLHKFRGQDALSNVVFSPDGKLLVTVPELKNTAQLWDTSSGQQRHELRGHTRKVTKVLFSMDGNQIATESFDATVRLWDTSSGQQRHELRGHTQLIRNMAFSPNGRQIVTASDDRTVRLWDTASGNELGQLPTTSRVKSIMFNPDGNQIAVASFDDNTTWLWDISFSKQSRVLRGHTKEVWSAVFSPDSRLVATASDDKTAQMWDTISGKQLYKLHGIDFQTYLYGVAFSPDGQLVATGSKDNILRLWNTASGKQLYELSGHNREINSIIFSPDGKLVATQSDDQTVRLWDTSSGKQLQKLRSFRNGIDFYKIKFSPPSYLIGILGLETQAQREVLDVD